MACHILIVGMIGITCIERIFLIINIVKIKFFLYCADMLKKKSFPCVINFLKNKRKIRLKLCLYHASILIHALASYLYISHLYFGIIR
jgi:hypothetical protein